MSDQEFNRLLNEVMMGLPVTIILNRMMMAVRFVVNACGESGEAALRTWVEERKVQDRDAYFEEEPL
jgi:hypothetical protein